MRPKKLTISETDIKSGLKDYLRLHHIFFFYNLQGIGAYKGIPDITIFWKNRVHFLEVKKPTGKLSEHQLEFKRQCKLDGIPYHVVTCLEDLQRIVG